MLSNRTALIFAALAAGLASPAWASTPALDLGTACSFAFLAGTSIDNSGNSFATGDAGSPSQSGFGTLFLAGTNHHGDSITVEAQNDLLAAYNDGQSRPVDSTLPAELGSTTVIPGVHDSVSGDFHIGGTVTLDGLGDPNAVFIFKMSSTLATDLNSAVALTNGAQAANIFWVSAGTAALGQDSTFAGSVMAQTNVYLGPNANVTGRSLALQGSVTLDTSTVTDDLACGGFSPTVSPTVSPTPTISTTATATITPNGSFTESPTRSVSPTRSPSATASITANGSFTETVTPSMTRSPTPSQTPTSTRTGTSTQTGTSTTTATGTATPSASPSSTGTSTPTGSSTVTPTDSSTLTSTGTRTSTQTSTTTPTQTVTATESPTTTSTQTETGTATQSATLTSSSTRTSTATETATATSSSTLTSSPTLTSSATRSATATPTETPVDSSTLTSSATLTSSMTRSATATPTETPANSTTLTSSATLTSSMTRSATATPTETPANSTTLTSSMTPSSTVTRTQTATRTTTITPNGTFTETPTFSVSPTGTQSQTPGTPGMTATPGTPDAYCYPSPARGDSATLAYWLRNSGDVTLRVYNQAGHIVDSGKEHKPGGWQSSQVSVGRFAPGAYFFQVSTAFDDGSSEAQSPGKFVVLH